MMIISLSQSHEKYQDPPSSPLLHCLCRVGFSPSDLVRPGLWILLFKDCEQPFEVEKVLLLEGSSQFMVGASGYMRGWSLVLAQEGLHGGFYRELRWGVGKAL